MRRLTAIAALIALATAPAAAAASPYSDVLHVYQTQGAIPPCRFSSSELAAALRGVDTYGQQYFADFSEAVQAALAARASGACTPGIAPRPSTNAAVLPRTPLPGSITAPTDSGIPAPILALAVLTALLLLGAAIGALAWSFGWDPSWAAAWRHAWGEAGYRLGGGLDEFADWWRSGR